MYTGRRSPETSPRNRTVRLSKPLPPRPSPTCPEGYDKIRRSSPGDTGVDRERRRGTSSSSPRPFPRHPSRTPSAETTPSLPRRLTRRPKGPCPGPSPDPTRRKRVVRVETWTPVTKGLSPESGFSSDRKRTFDPGTHVPKQGSRQMVRVRPSTHRPPDDRGPLESVSSRPHH